MGDLKTFESGDSEKKLWLDYLARLRDREDRSNQATGLTNWVLYGLAGTLLYKGIEFLPLAFSDRGYRYNTYIFAILGLNFLVFSQLALPELLPKMKDNKVEIRALPDRLQAFFVDWVGLFVMLVLSLGLIELWLGNQNPQLAKIERYPLNIFGIFHLFIGLALVVFLYISRKLDRAKQGMLPQFRGTPLRGQKIINSLMLLFAMVALVSIIFHGHELMHTKSNWLPSIQSAFGILVFLWAVYKLTVSRSGRAGIIAAIAGLEQQALIDNLSAPEIRERFEALLSGIKLREWLRESSESINKAWGDIANCLDAMTTEVDRVCSLPASDDKLQSLRHLKQKIVKETAEYREPFSVSSVQLGATVAVNWVLRKTSSKETINHFRDFKRGADEFDLRLKSLFEQLDTELARTTNNLTETGSRKALSATDQM